MRIHHLALRVKDLDAARRFYGDTLGLEMLSSEGPLVWFRIGDAVLMLERSLRGTGAEEGSGHVLALEVGDLAHWEERLSATGVEIDDRTPATLYFRDPEGHRVALSTYRFPTSSSASRETRS